MVNFGHYSILRHLYRETFSIRSAPRLVPRAQDRLYIHAFYNPSRLHSSLDYQSPLDFERNLNQSSIHNQNQPLKRVRIFEARSVWSALLTYVLLRYMAFVSCWSHSFTRIFTTVRCVLWRQIDLLNLLERYGTPGGSFRMLATPQTAYFSGF